MNDNTIKQLGVLGQSVWLDDIGRDLFTTGKLRKLIVEDGIKGMTSNPSIFEKSIAEGHDYDVDITAMAGKGKGGKEIYESLTQDDIHHAADAFRPVYDRTEGRDGFVSLEVNPHLAHDTKGTIQEARRLWYSLKRPNLFIKVPATSAGLPAIQQLISEGININVTLIFGLSRYREVAEAYIAGLETRIANGKPVSNVASVASFFISRIDVLIDHLIEKLGTQGGNEAVLAKEIHGQTGIASAKLAYQIYKETFGNSRFRNLSDMGARVQRLLWASTGTKNPNDSDVKYIEQLIGFETVNTVPIKTLDAFRDHGVPKNQIEENIDEAHRIMSLLPELGLSINSLTQQLEDEGVEKFNQQFDSLMAFLAKNISKQTKRNQFNDTGKE